MGFNYRVGCIGGFAIGILLNPHKSNWTFPLPLNDERQPEYLPPKGAVAPAGTVWQYKCGNWFDVTTGAFTEYNCKYGWVYR
jgi:hypothetical protein